MSEWDFPDDPPKRKRGRPKGVRNRPKDSYLTYGQLEKLYARVEPMLDDDHKKYLKGVITGQVPIDPLKEGQLLVRLLSIYVTEAIGWALKSNSISRDLGAVVREYRQGIKDLEDMMIQRETKAGDDERLVDATRESSLASFESLHRDNS